MCGNRARKIIDQLSKDLFDRPIMGNTARGFYAEAMVADILGEKWRLVSHDWSSWDIESVEGTKVEVKQSAYFQAWDKGKVNKLDKASPRFDIAERKIQWIEAKNVPIVGRPADYYIFCWHPEGCERDVDHRDSAQWQFIVSSANSLPAQKTIAWSVLNANEPALSSEELYLKMTTLVG